MGGSASVVSGSGGDPELFEKQLSVFLADEFERVTRLNLSGEELKKELSLIIKSKGLPAESLLQTSTSGKSVHMAPLLPEQCHAHLNRLIDRSSFTYVVAVDGSPTGDGCFALAMTMKKKQDKVLVLHSFNLTEQKTLPVHYQRDAVKSHYESLALSAGLSPKAVEDTVYLRERGDDETVRDAINSLIGEYAEVRQAGIDDTYYLPSKTIDFCVVGYCGRRGAEAQENNPTFMGSTTDMCLRSVHMPVIISKRPLPPPPSPLLYVVAVNNSHRSKMGVATVLAILRPRDKIIVIHIIKPTQGELGDQGKSEVDEISQYYNEELRLFGPHDSSMVLVPLLDNKSTAQTVVEYVNETCDPPPDFLCISPRSRINHNEETSSLSAGVIGGAKCNVLFLKSK